VRQADVIYTMTQAHRRSILAQWPEAADRTRPLCLSGGDIVDPIGGPLDRYQRCAQQIEAQLRARLEELPS
jgi:protein-tyrosine phosphatase